MNLPLFKNHKKKMVAALQANEVKAKGKMRDSNGGRCCLCVMQDSLCDTEDERRYLTDDQSFTLNHRGLAHEIFECQIPQIPVLILYYAGGLQYSEQSAAPLNDGSDLLPELSHKQIAECVNNIDLKAPKWSFYLNHRFIVELPKPMTAAQAQRHIQAAAKVWG